VLRLGQLSVLRMYVSALALLFSLVLERHANGSKTVPERLLHCRVFRMSFGPKIGDARGTSLAPGIVYDFFSLLPVPYAA